MARIRKRAPFLKRDEDVLDTWFSSALWPFSTLGWPDQTPELKRYYPTSVLVTGFDIIFFWVARMMMMGMHFMNEVPFRTSTSTRWCATRRAQKMSKSKGNVIDPLELIDEYGADALRFTLAAMAAQGRDIKLVAGARRGLPQLRHQALERRALRRDERRRPRRGLRSPGQRGLLADRERLLRRSEAAKSAHSLNPLAIEPLVAWAAAEETSGRLVPARRLYVRAVDLQPLNWQTWYELGLFDKQVLGDLAVARRELRRANELTRTDVPPLRALGRP